MRAHQWPHGKIARFVHETFGAPVEVWLAAKGASKSTATVQHRKLTSKEAVARLKAFWAERLDALEELLAR